ncbi:MAG: hypothetical protein Q4Q04_01665 [Methanocorpusculum sp.]|nr:hypothetical protein [Methanocorpusculum sp.]
MELKLKLCPVTRERCCSDACMWWDAEWKDCSVSVMVKYLRAADVRATFEHNVPAEFLDGERK